MTKCKLIFDFLKERDWLEEMAAEGWLLDNLTMGIFYHFKKVEPCQKVFEIDRFGLSANPQKGELTARQMAFDIAAQSGWEIVTHDEDMNYYFAKDKTGDEYDEFYDSEELRQERAEKYRRHYAVEQPRMLLTSWFAVSIIYVVLFLIMGMDSRFIKIQTGLMWFYIILTVIEIGVILLMIVCGENMYKGFVLTRQEWNLKKKYSQKKSFSKIKNLIGFLQEQDFNGLALAGYENGQYLFEESNQSYEYCADTKKSLSKRLKAAGKKGIHDKKDWLQQSTQWHEQSMQQASAMGYELVGAVEDGTLVYRRNTGSGKEQWATGAVYTSGMEKLLDFLKLIVPFLIICFIAGFIMGMLSEILM